MTPCLHNVRHIPPPAPPGILYGTHQFQLDSHFLFISPKWIQKRRNSLWMIQGNRGKGWKERERKGERSLGLSTSTPRGFFFFFLGGVLAPYSGHLDLWLLLSIVLPTIIIFTTKRQKTFPLNFAGEPLLNSTRRRSTITCEEKGLYFQGKSITPPPPWKTEGKLSSL